MAPLSRYTRKELAWGRTASGSLGWIAQSDLVANIPVNGHTFVSILN